MNPLRLGLRAQVIAAFTIGALVLSLVLSFATYSLTRANLVERVESLTLESAQINARRLQSQIRANGPNSIAGELGLLTVLDQAEQGVIFNGNEFITDAFQSEWTLDRVDDSLLRRLNDGFASRMVFESEGERFYAVGIPLLAGDAPGGYITAARLGDLESTLSRLRNVLLGASTVTTVLGLGFGAYTATRLFSPLAEISDAAEQIAAGDLSTRLREVTDPDVGRLVHSFNDMTGALESRIERDSRFASDVSHELRSPLMTLTGSVAVLERRRDEMPERAQLALDLLSTDVARFKQLVEDLLEISRFDVGAVQLETEEVIFEPFVAQAITAAVRGTREIPIVSGPNVAETFIDIDKRRIAQVIRNLSENADKYANGITQVRLIRTGDDIRIELEDEGPGVPVDERELIFERFSRGSEGGRRGTSSGVGLGLSLVAEHVALHGGSVSVTDRHDRLRGARFVISLPGVVIE